MMYEAALSIARQGWPVFPCRPTTKEPYSMKEFFQIFGPNCKWGHGFKDATTDEKIIKLWWTQWPNAMIAVPMGKLTGAFCVDLDKKNNINGVQTWANLQKDFGSCSPTRMHLTPSSGQHHLFQWLEGIVNIPLGKLADGIEIKGEGGYIIVPPSVMNDGRAYTGNNHSIIPAPNWLLNMMERYHEGDERDSGDPDLEGMIAGDVGKGTSTKDEDIFKNEPLDWETIEEALRQVPSDSYDDWYRVASAIHTALGESGFGLFDGWSSKSSKYNSIECKRKWKDARKMRGDIHGSTVLYLASQFNPNWWQQFRARRNQERIDNVGTNGNGHAEERIEQPKSNGHAPRRSLGLGVIDAGDDEELEKTPPREWLFGNIFARSFLSVLQAEGGTGKTALRYAQLISCAAGHSLTGDYLFQRCRVLIICLEDDIKELRRRIWAVCKHYGIARKDLKGWLFYCAPGINGGKFMTMDNRGFILEGKLANNIEAEVITHKMDIVSIDPFVKSHGVPENNNNAIDAVAQILVGLAHRYNIAVDTPHHVSKGPPDPGNADKGRGASSMKDAGRLVYTLNVMSAKEAESLGILEHERRLYIREDKGKVNIAPPARVAKWYKLIGVKLDNGNDLYPNGDEVQTVEPWSPPANSPSFLDPDVYQRILDEIDTGFPDGNRYSESSRAQDRAAWRVVTKHAPGTTEQQARDMITDWLRQGVLESKQYTQPKTGNPAKGLWVNKAQQAAAAPQQTLF
jgi:bifunctional DNA primase/polymerase-like protein/AAA domain-containing protein/primase-like protein